LSSDLNAGPSLRDLLRVFHRRRVTFFLTSAVILVVVATICLLSTRRYSATSTLEVQHSSKDGLGLDELMGAGGGGSDSLSVNVDLQTSWHCE
jgi:succinoglycan biosynthesis transport protein ExoP